jgi:hypothetical protein
MRWRYRQSANGRYRATILSRCVSQTGRSKTDAGSVTAIRRESTPRGRWRAAPIGADPRYGKLHLQCSSWCRSCTDKNCRTPERSNVTTIVVASVTSGGRDHWRKRARTLDWRPSPVHSNIKLNFCEPCQEDTLASVLRRRFPDYKAATIGIIATFLGDWSVVPKEICKQPMDACLIQ